MSTALLRVNLSADRRVHVCKPDYTPLGQDASETVSPYHPISKRLHTTSVMQATLLDISVSGTSIQEALVPGLFPLNIVADMIIG
jgi:hypothetical protein